MTIKKRKHHEVSITPDEITLHLGEMEPVVIPRASLRTRLKLIDWVYRLTGWPGMNVQALRAFIAAVFRHHGWGLSDVEDTTDDETLPEREAEPRLSAAVPA